VNAGSGRPGPLFFEQLTRISNGLGFEQWVGAHDEMVGEDR